MSASIRVESGISAGTSYWIDRPVLRIGSDPQCEICLPMADLAQHALTLEYRDGSYRAYNRGSSPITVGTSAVQPGASGIWRGDHTVHLPGDLQLLLQIDGDPRPCPRPEARLDDGFADEDGTVLAAADAGAAGATKEKKSSSTFVQLGIIGACILAIAAFLTLDRDATTSAPDRPTFDAIVHSTLSEEENVAARALLPRLQYAEAAVVRGHDELARSRFLKLRDQLVLQTENLPAKAREDAKRMLEYVEYRLGQLP